LKTIKPEQLGSRHNDIVTWSFPDEEYNVMFNTKTKEWEVDFYEWSEEKEDWVTKEIYTGQRAEEWVHNTCPNLYT